MRCTNDACISQLCDIGLATRLLLYQPQNFGLAFVLTPNTNENHRNNARSGAPNLLIMCHNVMSTYIILLYQPHSRNEGVILRPPPARQNWRCCHTLECSKTLLGCFVNTSKCNHTSLCSNRV